MAHAVKLPDTAASSHGELCRSLAELEPGQSVRLCDHEAPALARLADLGLVPGTVVSLVRRAPLGDPLEVELRGFRLCVRAADVARLCGRLASEAGTARSGAEP
jgi:Fe2+ transport system protein FeoA